MKKNNRMPNGSSAVSEWVRQVRPNMNLLAIVLSITAGCLMLAPGVTTWFNQIQDINDLKAQVAAAKEAVKNMQAERKRWDDPVYIRAQARDRLYYVMPGEVSYLVMDADGINTSDTSGTVGAKLAERSNGGRISSSISESKNNWIDAVYESVVRAGLDEPIPEAATK